MRVPGVTQDEVGFAAFYETSRGPCLRAVCAVVGDRRLAEDLVAEGFARAWAAWPKVSKHPAPRGWVLRTALNLRVSWWRRRRRELPLVGADWVLPAATPEGIDPSLMAAVNRLSARQRQVIVLRVLLDLDTHSTADVLGIAPGTVTAHLCRAADALQRDLAEGHYPMTVERNP
jgi:DNA-directed RNA polymerase specialized sigma24 family protein